MGGSEGALEVVGGVAGGEDGMGCSTRVFVFNGLQ